MSLRLYTVTAVRVRVFWNETPPRFIESTNVSITDVLKFRRDVEDNTFFHKLVNTRIQKMADFSHDTFISLFITQLTTRPCYM